MQNVSVHVRMLGKCTPVSLASSTWGIDLVGSLFHIMVVRFKMHISCLFKVFQVILLGKKVNTQTILCCFIYSLKILSKF